MKRPNDIPMPILWAHHLGRLLPVVAFACSGAPFSAGGDISAGGGGSQSFTQGGAITSPPEQTQTTNCGSGRVDELLHATEVCIPGSQFVMGSSASIVAGGGFADHTPSHNISLSTYFIDAYEVSVARFRQCVVAGACAAPTGTGTACTYSPDSGESDQLPVTCILYATASAFCKWDGGRRLPTEAEWERAARGTTGNDYPWGPTFDCRHAVAATVSSCTEFDSTKPSAVETTPDGKSPEGVVDLIGNAAEWVADFVGSYSQKNETTDPLGPTTGTQRVVRGGDWLTPANQTLAYLRRSALPSNAGSFGFRCARSVR